MRGGVYLLGADNGLTKIGRATNVHKRLKALQIGSPLPLRLVHVIETGRGAELERILHRQFSHQRRSGEWFELSADDIVAVQNFCLDDLPEPVPPAPSVLAPNQGYTVAEVAEQLRLHPQTVREWLRDGKLSGVRLGGTKAGWRISEHDIDALLARQRAERLPQPTVGAERRAAARRAALEQAEQARQRGDDEGAERFEAMASGMGR